MKKDITNFIEGNYLYLKYYLEKDIEKHIKEQALYRAFLCLECLEKGRCVVCNCNTPAMFFAPKKVDSKDKWGKMLNSKDWEIFKKENNIELPQSLNDLINKIKMKDFNFKNLKKTDFVSNYKLVYPRMDIGFLTKLDYIKGKYDFEIIGCQVPTGRKKANPYYSQEEFFNSGNAVLVQIRAAEVTDFLIACIEQNVSIERHYPHLYVLMNNSFEFSIKI